MIALDRLSQIIPPDQALANKALATALQQVAGIQNLTLSNFSAVVGKLETNRDLPLINSQTTPISAATAAYYQNIATGSGQHGTISINDIIGLAAGWLATDAFAKVVAIFATMDLTYLTLIFQTIANATNGDYGDTDYGPLTIPGGLPCAGTYVGSPMDPLPPSPPYCDPTALNLALACLNGSINAEVANLQSEYPTQCAELNTVFNDLASQIVSEQAQQSSITTSFNTLVTDTTSAYGLVYSLPSYGQDTTQGGMAQFIENIADITTSPGQAIIAALREGRNQSLLGNGGVQTNSNVPAQPIPVPPMAKLLPSTYTEAEAVALLAPKL